MACFLIPMALGIVTLALGRAFPKRLHIGWLSMMLWGGVAMLGAEHFVHGEMMPYPPFLNIGIETLPEIFTVGTTMAASTIFAWSILVFINESLLRKRMVLNIKPRMARAV